MCEPLSVCLFVGSFGRWLVGCLDFQQVTQKLLSGFPWNLVDTAKKEPLNVGTDEDKGCARMMIYESWLKIIRGTFKGLMSL